MIINTEILWSQQSQGTNFTYPLQGGLVKEEKDKLIGQLIES